MARYIDADKCRQIAIERTNHFADRLLVIGCIEDTPAEDVAPVVHAHWVVKKETDCYGDHWRTYIICSKCDHVTFKRWNYCPHCGAIMDGKDTQETHKEG